MAKNYATTDFNLQKKLGNVLGKKKASDGIIKILDKIWNLQKNPDYSVMKVIIAQIAYEINMNPTYLYELIKLLKDKGLLEVGRDKQLYTTRIYNELREACYQQTKKEYEERYRHIDEMNGHKKKFKRISKQKYQSRNSDNKNKNSDDESAYVGDESELFFNDFSIGKNETIIEKIEPAYKERARAHFSLSTREEILNTRTPIDSACGVASHTETPDLQSEEGSITKNDQVKNEGRLRPVHINPPTPEGGFKKQASYSTVEAQDGYANKTMESTTQIQSKTTKPPKQQKSSHMKSSRHGKFSKGKSSKRRSNEYPIPSWTDEETAEAVYRQVKRDHSRQVTELIKSMTARGKYLNKYAIEAIYKRLTAMKLNRINTYDVIDQSLLLNYNWIFEPTKKYYDRKYKYKAAEQKEAMQETQNPRHNPLYFTNEEPKRIFNFQEDGVFY